MKIDQSTAEGQAFKAEAARWAAAVLTAAAELLREGRAFDPKNALQQAQIRVQKERKAAAQEPLTGDQEPEARAEGVTATNAEPDHSVVTVAIKMPKGTAPQEANRIGDVLMARAKESRTVEEDLDQALERVAKEHGLETVRVGRRGNGLPDLSAMTSMLEAVLGLKPVDPTAPTMPEGDAINMLREAFGMGPCTDPDCVVHGRKDGDAAAEATTTDQPLH